MFLCDEHIILLTNDDCRPFTYLAYRAAISNRRSAICNIAFSISLSLPAGPIDKDIGLTMFQIADPRLLVADVLSATFVHALRRRTLLSKRIGINDSQTAL